MNETGVDTPRVNPFRAILFTDLRGSTSILETVGQSAFMVLLTEHDLIIRRALVASRGREVKHTGDGIMASFDDVASALECSIAIQAGFDARAADGPSPELRVRIGIAAGEPVDHNGDLFGSTVTLASRICDAAEAGHVLTSDLVCDLGRQKGYRFDAGRRAGAERVSRSGQRLRAGAQAMSSVLRDRDRRPARGIGITSAPVPTAIRHIRPACPAGDTERVACAMVSPHHLDDARVRARDGPLVPPAVGRRVLLLPGPQGRPSSNLGSGTNAI